MSLFHFFQCQARFFPQLFHFIQSCCFNVFNVFVKLLILIGINLSLFNLSGKNKSIVFKEFIGFNFDQEWTILIFFFTFVTKITVILAIVIKRQWILIQTFLTTNTWKTINFWRIWIATGILLALKLLWEQSWYFLFYQHSHFLLSHLLSRALLFLTYFLFWERLFNNFRLLDSFWLFHNMWLFNYFWFLDNCIFLWFWGLLGLFEFRFLFFFLVILLFLWLFFIFLFLLDIFQFIFFLFKLFG